MQGELMQLYIKLPISLFACCHIGSGGAAGVLAGVITTILCSLFSTFF